MSKSDKTYDVTVYRTDGTTTRENVANDEARELRDAGGRGQPAGPDTKENTAMGILKTAKWALSTKDERRLSEVREHKGRKPAGGRRDRDVDYTNGFIVSGKGQGTSYVLATRRNGR
jgi:hypothetical protein